MSITRLQHITKIGVEDMGDLADAASHDSSAILRLENLDTDLRPPVAAAERHPERAAGRAGAGR